MENKINIGVSLYSMTAAYTRRLLTFDDCIRKAAEMGYEGIEIVAQQSVPGYPYPSEAWCEHFRQLMADNRLTPVCYGTYIDPGRRSDREPTPEEIIRDTTNDLLVAKSLGFRYVRTLHEFGPETFYKMLPICRKLDMRLVIELHSPHNPRTPVWEKYIEIMARAECRDFLGINLDMGIMQKRPQIQVIRNAIQDQGCRPDKIHEITEALVSGRPVAEIADMTPAEKSFAEMNEYRCANSATLEEVRAIMPYTMYIHGKFYHIDENLEETCIPYREIIQIIKETGYTGFISSEYEGHGFDKAPMEFEVQLNRFREMLKKHFEE